MTLDATEVMVAGNGHIYVADEGTDLPVDLSDLSTDPDWTECGYTTTDGVTFTLSRQTSEIPAWQSNDPLRIVETGRTTSLAAVLEQFNPDNLLLAFGGGDFESGVEFGSYTFPLPGVNAVKVLVVDAIDGEFTTRFIYDRVQQVGDITTNLQRGDASTLPISFQVLAGAQLPTIISDLASFLNAS